MGIADAQCALREEKGFRDMTKHRNEELDYFELINSEYSSDDWIEITPWLSLYHSTLEEEVFLHANTCASRWVVKGFTKGT